MNNGSWHYIAWVRNSSALTVYIDGSLAASNTDRTGTVDSTNANLGIGGVQNSPPAYLFNGLMDDVRLYKRELTAGEIQVLADFHAVTFDANNGSGTMANQTANAPTALTSNNFTKPGHSFSGWNIAANGGGTAYADGAVYSFAADTTLYAQWTELPTYTLTYTVASNGSVTAPATSPTTHNSGAVVTITALASAGSHFVNWTGDVGTIADVNAASTTITMNGNYAITANFAVDTYTLTYTVVGSGTITAPSYLTHHSQ